MQIDDKILSELRIKEVETEKLQLAKKFIESLLKYRQATKLYDTYIVGVQKAIAYNGVNKVFVDNRIDGTVTGRLSNAADKAEERMGVSFHTLSRESIVAVRSMFVAPDNWKFITADYGSMEMRIMAHYCQDPNMIQAIKDGKDLHRFTASLVFDRPEHLIMVDERQIAKSMSFLILYGGGATKLATMTGISLYNAQKILGKYKEAYPTMFNWINRVHEKIKQLKYAYTAFGRRRRLPNVDSLDRDVVARCLRQGVNFIIQSTASDILLASMLDILDKFDVELGIGEDDFIIKSKGKGTVHDSFEAICQENIVERAVEIIKDCMLNYRRIKEVFGFECLVPFEVDIHVDKCFV